MKIEMMMIGAVLFGVVFSLGLNFYGEMLSNYNVDIDTSSTFGEISNNAKEIAKINDQMQGDIEGGSVTEGDAVEDMIAGGYSAIKNSPFSAIGVAAEATETLLLEFHMVPAEAIDFIILVLSLLTLFAIIGLIFRFEQR